MTYYFLVGSQAVSTYPDIANIVDSWDGDVIRFDTETMNPPMLMQMVDGWNDYVEITEAEYETIYNQLHPESK
jgi:hypothetical protein